VKKQLNVKKWLIGLVILLFCLLPLLLNNRYWLHIGVTAGIYIMLCLGLYIVSGLTSQLNLGQAGFWALGAYSYGILVSKYQWSFLNAALAAVGITLVLSLMLGLPALKVSGVAFAMVTLGASEIIKIILLNWPTLTGGGMGLRNILKPNLFGITITTPFQFYILTLLLVGVCFFITLRLINSYAGLSMRAVGSNETVSMALGINAFHIKMLAFAINSCFAAISGILFASYYGFIHPEAFTSAQSFALIQFLVIGGILSLPGVMIMTPVLIIALEYMRAFGEYQMITYAVMSIVVLIFFPKGVGGFFTKES
jgi:branched-chain amino acid transport system permease protein